MVPACSLFIQNLRWIRRSFVIFVTIFGLRYSNEMEFCEHSIFRSRVDTTKYYYWNLIHYILKCFLIITICYCIYGRTNYSFLENETIFHDSFFFQKRPTFFWWRLTDSFRLYHHHCHVNLLYMPLLDTGVL